MSQRAALAVAGITAASRVMGLVRTLAATWILGVTFLGNTYVTANSIPNLFFEIVAGGALAAAVVPALTGAFAKGDVEEGSRRTSAFLNVTLLLLTPVAIAAILLRGPLMGLMTSAVADPLVREAQRELGEFFLLLFVPQIWIYGIGIVLTGVLHANERFYAPALAPLLSSVVVTASYIVFAYVEPAPGALDVSHSGRSILAGGTTLGVLVLSLSLVPSTLKLGVRWRAVLRMPRDLGAGTRRLVLSAAAAVSAQQILLALVLRIGNGVEGGVVAYQLAFAVMLLPWAILAVPIGTTSFPVLAASFERGDSAHFANELSSATRTVLFLCFGGAALMFGLAGSGTDLVLSLGLADEGRSSALVASAVRAFAPGLVPYGLYALLSRACYARMDGRTPMVAAIAGFGSALVLDVLASRTFRGPTLVGALAGGFSAGMMVAGVILVWGLHRAERLFIGLGREFTKGLLCAAAASATGIWIDHSIRSRFDSILMAVATAGSAAAVVYLSSQWLLGNRGHFRRL